MLAVLCGVAALFFVIAEKTQARLFHFLPRLFLADLQDTNDLPFLFLESHHDAAQFRRVKANQDLAVWAASESRAAS